MSTRLFVTTGQFVPVLN